MVLDVKTIGFGDAAMSAWRGVGFRRSAYKPMNAPRPTPRPTITSSARVRAPLRIADDKDAFEVDVDGSGSTSSLKDGGTRPAPALAA